MREKLKERDLSVWRCLVNLMHKLTGYGYTDVNLTVFLAD